ncbi:hypothetical protein [Streptomyces sp. P9-2B-2]|nr:hypothetical protein [Streptomyces sp. P9-2B-2]WJY41173.1 hypothetical protein QT196_30030 [Streptomyces sp. P9-2B-2]
METEDRDRKQELLQAERRRRWYEAISQARQQQIEQHRGKFLIEQIGA